jgi:hypothetical protein
MDDGYAIGNEMVIGFYVRSLAWVTIAVASITASSYGTLCLIQNQVFAYFPILLVANVLQLSCQQISEQVVVLETNS